MSFFTAVLNFLRLSWGLSWFRNALILFYVLFVLGFSAVSRAEVGIYPVGSNNSAYAAKVFKGQLVITLEEKAYLITSRNSYIELQTDHDLSDFNGKFVEVLGYDLTRKAEPVVQLMSFNPAMGNLENENEKVVPSIIVLDIRVLTNIE